MDHFEGVAFLGLGHGKISLEARAIGCADPGAQAARGGFRASARLRLMPDCQHFRELFLRAGLKARSGVFVEIGAFDGESYSNTSFLADQGWKGLYVEPMPEFCARTRARHRLNSVDVLQAAIAAEVGEMEMTVMGALTTSDSEVVKLYGEVEWSRDAWQQRKTCTVKTLPLEAALEQAGIPAEFDLLVVDVEGSRRRNY